MVWQGNLVPITCSFLRARKEPKALRKVAPHSAGRNTPAALAGSPPSTPRVILSVVEGHAEAWNMPPWFKNSRHIISPLSTWGEGGGRRVE